MQTHGHLQLEQFKLAPSQEWVDQTGMWRFVRAHKGAAYWLEHARPRSFTEGELLVLAPGIPAVIRASQLNEVVLHRFNFSPDLLSGFFTVAEKHVLARANLQTVSPVKFLPTTHPLTQRFEALATRRDHGPRLAERGELLSLAVAFLSEFMPGHPRSPTANSTVQHRFQEILSAMPDVEFIHHTPDELARLCGCSARHFHRLFRQYFGESPRARQTELRLLRSRQLLASTHQKVLQIAQDSGYRSLSLFNSLFKRRFGLSPSAWRETTQHTEHET